MRHSTEREQLLSAVHNSRRELRDGILETRQAADITSRVKASVKKNLIWWIGGSLVAGICVASATSNGETQIETGKGEKMSGPRKRSFFSALTRLIKFLFSVSSPVLKSLLTREVVSALSKIERDGPSKS